MQQGIKNQATSKSKVIEDQIAPIYNWIISHHHQQNAAPNSGYTGRMSSIFMTHEVGL